MCTRSLPPPSHLSDKLYLLPSAIKKTYYFLLYSIISGCEPEVVTKVNESVKSSVEPVISTGVSVAAAAGKDGGSPNTGARDDGADLDVESMLKDFSDKLKDNLVPDPWE